MSESFTEVDATENKKSLSLAERFKQAMLPHSEEDIYQAAMQRKFWTVDEFAALMGGLIPENYKKGSKGTSNISDENFARREASLLITEEINLQHSIVGLPLELIT